MDPQSKEMWRLTGRFASVGIEMGVALVIGYYIGRAFDWFFAVHVSVWVGRDVSTAPYGMYFWTFAGLGASFLAVWDAYKLARRTTMQDDLDDPAGR
jgi:hypothetical protein